MSENKQQPSSAGGRRIVVRSQPRSEPDLRRLARALIELARQELAEEAKVDPEAASPDGEEAA